jgi:hypothetical protein
MRSLAARFLIMMPRQLARLYQTAAVYTGPARQEKRLKGASWDAATRVIAMMMPEHCELRAWLFTMCASLLFFVAQTRSQKIQAHNYRNTSRDTVRSAKYCFRIQSLSYVQSADLKLKHSIMSAELPCPALSSPTSDHQHGSCWIGGSRGAIDSTLATTCGALILECLHTHCLPLGMPVWHFEM